LNQLITSILKFWLREIVHSEIAHHLKDRLFMIHFYFLGKLLIDPCSEPTRKKEARSIIFLHGKYENLHSIQQEQKPNPIHCINFIPSADSVYTNRIIKDKSRVNDHAKG
jgi:hypothetical protein